jgi:hypothetical protein
MNKDRKITYAELLAVKFRVKIYPEDLTEAEQAKQRALVGLRMMASLGKLLAGLVPDPDFCEAPNLPVEVFQRKLHQCFAGANAFGELIAGIADQTIGEVEQIALAAYIGQIGKQNGEA